LWHELKEYLRREVKPRNLSKVLWSFGKPLQERSIENILDILKKVIPRVIELEGAATGY